jgi:hypothetical protein
MQVVLVAEQATLHLWKTLESQKPQIDPNPYLPNPTRVGGVARKTNNGNPPTNILVKQNKRVDAHWPFFHSFQANPALPLPGAHQLRLYRPASLIQANYSMGAGSTYLVVQSLPCARGVRHQYEEPLKRGPPHDMLSIFCWLH